MTDRFDKAMADIAVKSAANGGPTIQDVLTAMRASHDDANDGRKELATKVESTAAALHKEVIEAARQRGIDIEASAKVIKQDLREYRMEQASRCAEEHKKLLADEFQRHERAPRRKGDSVDQVFGGMSLIPEITFSYRFFKWLLMVSIVIALGWGLPFWADSCASKNAEKVNAPEPAVHVLTPSPKDAP
jgi:hypothetical protein